MIFNFFLLLHIAVLNVHGQSAVDDKNCPPHRKGWVRVGQTRFYVIHAPTRGDFVDWNSAHKKCKDGGMELAKIDKLTTFAMVGRILEEIVTNASLKDTWYWLDAKFNDKTDVYEWGSGGELQYGNFFYRQPRPTGVGGWVTWMGEYDSAIDKTQCLTLALPWPGAQEQVENAMYGHSTSLDEKPCISTKKRHAICQSSVEDCKLMTMDPFELTEDKDDYFHKGHWIIGERRFIVNMFPRNYEDSKKYCERLGLQMYSPKPLQDVCLVPLLKMWTRNVTLSHYWTNWKYNAKSENFTDVNGTVVGNAKVEYQYKEDMNARSSRRDSDFCVSLMLQYEFKDQLPLCNTKSACSWSFMSYVPSNCFNKLGTICQHKDYIARGCTFKSEYPKNVTLGLEETSTVKFGYNKNDNVLRSRYKQTFGTFYCPKGYRVMRANNTMWYEKPVNSSLKLFDYDYKETFWVVDEEGFNKTATSTCLVSEFGDRKTPKKVPCTTWNFYLCEMFRVAEKKFEGKIKTEKAEWNKRIQRRHYPIFS